MAKAIAAATMISSVIPITITVTVRICVSGLSRTYKRSGRSRDLCLSPMPVGGQIPRGCQLSELALRLL